MAIVIHEHPLETPLVERLASWLLARAPGAADGDLTGCLIVLPSVRAAATLRHALLDASGRAALLLPEIVTPRQLAASVAVRLGLPGGRDVLAPDALRPLLLAGRLHALPWAAAHPESAAGLAEELVRVFDEARLAGSAERLLGDADGIAPAGLAEREDELYRRDRERLAAAWSLYREAAPRDGVDQLVEAAGRLGAAGAAGTGLSWRLVVVAGFSDLDDATARLLRAVLHTGQGHLFLAQSASWLARGFAATFLDADSPSHPLAAGRRLIALLAGDAAAQRDEMPADDPPPPAPELLACADAEAESGAIAALVCAALAQRGSQARIAVATADRALARRVIAQLRDAGLDADDTGGLPLASLPSGRLAHHLLAAATHPRHETLLELLAHPFTRLAASRAEHARRALMFEKMLLRGQAPPGDLEECRSRAAKRDEALLARRPRARALLAPLVANLAAALAPLRQLHGEAVAWRDLTAALRRTWLLIAPDHPLEGAAARAAATAAGGRRLDEEGLQALADLLHELDVWSPRLAAGNPADLAADLDRLLAARVVRPHRSPLLPVQVMGLLEARLERFDLLILAGASEETLPGRLQRPLLLGEAARAAAGLPSWRRRLGLQAELLLRLLHNGGRVVITWPRERAGQPVLPSPFLERLALALGRELPRAEDEAAPAAIYRRSPPDHAALEAAQRAFAVEPLEIPARAPRPLRRAGHTALSHYRGCPYRFLLEKGHALAEQEDVLAEFRRLDLGRRAHACLQSWLAPASEGAAKLAAGDHAGSLAALRRAASVVFGEGPGAPAQRRLWEMSFLAAAPELVERELARWRSWRPAALECRFKLTLADLHAWLVREAGGAAGAPAPTPPSADAAALLLTGTIDRIDTARDRGGRAVVIDYKTGRLPAARAVAEAEEPQLLLYAIAVETGAASALGGPLRVEEAGYYRIAGRRAQLRTFSLAEGDKPGREALREGARRLLQEAAAATDAGGVFPLIPRQRAGDLAGQLPCRHCPFRGVCRIDERPVPPRVGALLVERTER